LSTSGSISGAVKAQKTSGEPPNQAATSSAQRRWPAAQAVASATDSGTAAKMPGLSGWL
jgi:hypothetical protein